MAFAHLFEEAKGMDRFALGGKGFGLVEMTSIGLPVPPGMVVTTDACKEFLRTGRVPPALFEEVRSKIRELEKKTGKRLGSGDSPLL
ncbi:MAG: hypothetical protein JRM86_03670, partial [Nitrososphaerota archaeon]|nr:hypothetical protein [Nitrososphaerota archaeon]